MSERQSHFLSERVGVGVWRGRLRCAIAIQENGKGGPFCVEWYSGIESSVEMGNQSHAEPVCLVLSFFSLDRVKQKWQHWTIGVIQDGAFVKRMWPKQKETE